jgi:uncharacterized Rmd1/YagE family protein
MSSEHDPLLPTHSNPQPIKAPPKPHRSVTFNPTVTAQSPPSNSLLKPSPQHPAAAASTSKPSGQPVLSALNNKLRRRNSSGSVLTPPPLPAPKIGPQRTTRTVQKLKLLPDPEQGEDGPDEESGRDVYAQFTRIKDPTSRRDAARLGKEDRKRLPRVTAYCTATSYKLDDLMRFLKGKTRTREAAPKLFDECIYTPYRYVKAEQDSNTEQNMLARAENTMATHPRRYSDSAIEVETHNEQRRDDLIDFHTGEGSSLERPSLNDRTGSDTVETGSDFDTTVHIPEVFVFEYGTVVIWGMSIQQEHRFLRDISKFEVEKLAKEDIVTEDFNFYYTREYQARIYNDFISLREKRHYMTKLAISHALSQSVKVQNFLNAEIRVPNMMLDFSLRRHGR